MSLTLPGTEGQNEVFYRALLDRPMAQRGIMRLRYRLTNTDSGLQPELQPQHFPVNLFSHSQMSLPLVPSQGLETITLALYLKSIA